MDRCDNCGRVATRRRELEDMTVYYINYYCDQHAPQFGATVIYNDPGPNPIYSGGWAWYWENSRLVRRCDCPRYYPRHGCRWCDPRAVYERCEGRKLRVSIPEP